MTKVKKFGGTINGWRKVPINSLSPGMLFRAYGPNLGYIITGWLSDDPQHRGFEGIHGMQTSLVVKINKDETKIETLNTKYDLGVPYGEG